MDLSCLEDLYSDNKGRPPYNVYDLLAATLYGFTQGISSCRKLANASKENICMMWLLNMEDKIANQIFSSVLYDSENINISIPEEISE